MSEELLDLSQIAAPKDTIRLPSRKDPEGKSYEIVNPDDLGVLHLGRLRQLQEEENRLRASVKNGKPTPAQKRALRKCLGDAVKILMPGIDAPALAMLPNEARERIIIAWTMKHYAADDEPSAEGKKKSRRTGAASSRGSKRSTAAARKSGSTSRGGS